MYQYYRIAGLTVKMDTFGRTAELALPYRIPPCREVDITIDPGYQILKAFASELDDEMCEYMTSGRVFYRNLLHFDGLMLHAAAVAVDGKAYLFSADSGVGKSTHAKLWQLLLGEDRVQIINDDKPALRLENGVWYAYGTPWCGKHGINRNLRCPLAGICFLERGEHNGIQPYAGSDLVFRLLKQTYRSKNTQLKEKTLQHIGNLMDKVSMWRLTCNMEPEAAMVSYQAMTGEQYG